MDGFGTRANQGGRRKDRGARLVALTTLVAAAVAWSACSRPDPGATVSAVSEDDAKAAFSSSISASSGARTLLMRITGGVTTTPAARDQDCNLFATAAGPTTVEIGIDRHADFFTLANAERSPRAVIADYTKASSSMYLARNALPGSWGVAKPWVFFPPTGPREGSLAPEAPAEVLFPAFTTGAGVNLLRPDANSAGDVFDPDAMLAMLRDQTQSVTSLGEDDVDGEPAQHFRLTIDPAGVGRGGTTTIADTAGTIVTTPRPAFTTVDAEVWLRPDGKVTRLRVAAAGTSTGSVDGVLRSTPDAVEFEASTDIRFLAYDDALPLTVPAVTDWQTIDDLPAAAVLGWSDRFNHCVALLSTGFAKGAGVENGPTAEEYVPHLACQRAEQIERMGSMTVAEWRQHLTGSLPPGTPLFVAMADARQRTACPPPG